MLGLSPWVTVLCVMLAAVLARALPRRSAGTLEQVLNGKAIVVAVAVIAGAVALWMWGSLSNPPVIQDETAYLLQAELFAHLRWTGAAPPLPEFFEQAHVLVDGLLASKYPPGNSLVLALGAVIGQPGLPVVILNACAVALMFVLARRAAGGGVALLTVVIWESSFPMIYYHTGYMSESVSSLAWLVTWWAIARWRAGDGRRWLTIAAAAVAWCMITRPLTGLALALVAAAVVFWHWKTARRWRDLVPALGMAAAILAIVPLWSWRTTGDPLSMPLTRYTNTYIPFDKPGFAASLDERPSPRLPRDQARVLASFYQEHVRHTWRSLPPTAWARLTMIDRDMFYEWRGGLRVFALVGFLAMTGEAWMLLVAFAVQFVLYLSYAHPPGWSVYYVEGTPILAFAVALGLVRAFALVANSERRSKDSGQTGERERPLTIMTGLLAATRSVDDPAVTSAASFAAAFGLVAMFAVARNVKQTLRDDHAYYDAFADLVKQIPDQRAVVFVRYGATHLDGMSLIRNVPDMQHAPVWTAYDRGPDNARLMALAPERTPYLFDESTWTLRRLDIASMQSGKR